MLLSILLLLQKIVFNEKTTSSLILSTFTQFDCGSGNVILDISGLKEPYLGSNLFLDKASHENKHLCKILFAVGICFLNYVKLNLW